MNRPLNSKRGPHYVYRLFGKDGPVLIDHGNGWRMSRQMRDLNRAAEIVETCPTESEAYALANELRRRTGGAISPAAPYTSEPTKDFYSRERIQEIIEWNIQSLDKYPDDLLMELRQLHECDTHQELIAKMIADCLFHRL